MKTLFSLALAMLVAVPSLAQIETTKLKIRVAVVDKDLNIKSVPKFALTLKPVSSGEAILLTTDFDGIAEQQIPVGAYHLATVRPLEFQGKQYSWELDISVKPGENQIELSNDNAKHGDITVKQSRVTDELAEYFKHFQNSVVTVWSEIGHGTGFLIDPKGLVVTNAHVVAGSNLFAVQFDPQHKVAAVLLAYDGPRDVAILWANFAKMPEAITAPLLAKGDSPVVEGEKVFTIGSPLSQRKIMSTGIVGKLEDRAIISDIHIDHGSSGGPLFNSLGAVVGLTTFGESPTISGIVRIEEAFPAIDQARAKMVSQTLPAPDFLPVAPPGTFPLEALKDVFNRPKFDTHPYRFEESDYEVIVWTPPLEYYLKELPAVQAARQKEKRRKKAEEPRETSDLLPEMQNWLEYVGEYSPVVIVRVTPKLRETTGSKWRRGLVAGLAHTQSVATLRYKTDFYRMKLKCGDKEVTPIQPGRFAMMKNEQNQVVNAVDASYGGVYSYLPDAFASTCGQMTLELYSEKNPNSPTTKTIDPKTVSTVWEDFGPYRAYAAASPQSTK